MPTGVMLRWNDDKGFGFIKPDDDDGPDLFAHVSQLLDGEGSVRDGDAVRFKMEYDDRKGKDRATNVEVLEGGRGPRSRGRSRIALPAALLLAVAGAVAAAAMVARRAGRETGTALRAV
ncbi:unnamed protein product [Polarella glacialis]|uniref:CSD domain-containing protein n=1 Tax=Polarella glacialis TaxID=89957 RepID=A0A813K7H1_POLGL|nr:unnamed protein product [Polarella glacialis]